MKISVFKSKYVMVIAHHFYDTNFIIRNFADHNEAADFIEFLAKDDL